MKIYLAQQEGSNLYKIGVTKKRTKIRLNELQTGNANKLVLIEEYETIFGYKLETALHAHYRGNKIRSEWFEMRIEEVEDFLNQCRRYETTFKMLKKSENPFFKC